MDVSKFRKDLINKVKNLKLSYVESISMIGSFLNSKELFPINDIDLLLIIDNLDLQKFRELENSFNSIAKDLSSDKNKVVIETKKGPIKPLPQKNKNIIQLHLLIWDKKKFIKESRDTILFDALFFGKHIYGKPLKNFKNINKISRESLLWDLEKNKKGIEENKIYMGVFKEIKGKLKEIVCFKKLSKNRYADLITNNIIMSFVNYVRYNKKMLKKDKELLFRESKKSLIKKYQDVLEKAFKINKSIKEGKSISEDEILYLKEDGKTFINYLISKI